MSMTLSSYPNSHLKLIKLSWDVQPLKMWYVTAQALLQVIMCAIWRVRVFNRRYEPTDGGVLYVCNHQSFLDPPMVGFSLRRPVHFMARDTLFRGGPFEWLIRSLNAFPVRRERGDVGAMKESLRRLKGGHPLVVFPEGTRTRDGHIGRFRPGAAMLAQRGADWIVPVLIDGAYECWPRAKKIPSLGSIVVQYGRPIPKAVARAMTPQELANHVRQTLIEMQADVRRRVGRPPLQYDD
ncbi:MAG: lysophospholipid acyltransferase family protein [Planctomycetota bacterium]|jgi:1-acyl-sn-glycerol-3-phosphate acyltransferase